MTIYYSLFVRNEQNKIIELQEKTLFAAEKLAEDLRAEGLEVEIIERYNGPMETDPNYNDFVTPAWKRY